jgi:hypothetical protein
MLFRETVAVCYENHTELTHAPCGQNGEVSQNSFSSYKIWYFYGTQNLDRGLVGYDMV